MRASSRPLLLIPLRMALHRLLEFILTPSALGRADHTTGNPAWSMLDGAPPLLAPWGPWLIIPLSLPCHQGSLKTHRTGSSTGGEGHRLSRPLTGTRAGTRPVARG